MLIVHGGGPQATALQKQLGIETNIVGGRRVTDAATLDVMKMVVAGKLNVDLCATLVGGGVSAVGAARRERRRVAAHRRPPRWCRARAPPVDLGLVGDVVGFNSSRSMR